ncbi:MULTISPECIES: DUF397 domain-containing protein [Streptomycetaceae]|uniref:DUF397 domain-containing protein n=1 Tax=Streptantibioticus cattleyicolor (strain ATCC 35852 / DSM 46488 / JCM 4925 / NBRC 14057 / NRRL 8057) TaxID=1003195 RepID=F8JTD6_STREN|nr:MULTISPECIES: DUF397 domain-containing protein [Streptomycetaceae]AEW94289.1 protein of unknown function DUF397 [Streptantibioticus cattleyicolor NRRL 8057 = DSM 46488]MYS58945.1 DUF397 domain-containing protein [Streptomyces sp. SID5468]CCB74646.1 putative regulatory protein [Streptantibioticus cattleyicolor NRRL 8057 = DSM 46488]
MNTYIESASAAGVEWTKSSHSGNNNNCVEVAALGTGIRAIRDSKDPHGPALTFTAREFAAFVHAAADGEFD